MKYFLLILLIVISTLSFEKSFAQMKGDDEAILKIIQKHGRAFIKNKNITSASIGILKDGYIYTEHFGEIEKGKGLTPTDESIYEIGSVTKTLTGYLAAKAVLENKLGLDDELSVYLKDDYPNLKYKGKPITVKHLLSHTSGLPMFLPAKIEEVFQQFNEKVPQDYYELEKSYTKQTFLEDLKQVSITTEPGSVYSYSNVGAELLGYILESIYQTTIDELLYENFSNPYGMDSSFTIAYEANMQNLVRGYWMDNEKLSPPQLNSLWATGGGAKMTIMDMMHYIDLYLNPENTIATESHRVLHEEGKTLKVAYFWRVRNDKYGTSYNHHGGTTGTQNWLFIYPKLKLGLSIMTNQSGPKTPNLLSKTAKKIIKKIVRE